MTKGYNKEGHNVYSGNSPISKYFVDKYIKTLETPEMVATVSSFEFNYKLITHSSEMEFGYKYTDEEFFNLCDFNFVEGRPYNKVEYENQDKLIVIDEKTANFISPKGSAIGKTFEIYSTIYKVVGVVENADATKFPVATNIYIPMSTNPVFSIKENTSSQYCSALILAKSKKDFPKILNELENKNSKIEVLNQNLKNRHKVELKILAAERLFVILNTATNKSVKELKSIVNWVLFIILSMFLLLPIINLVNINKTRMAERAEEIGVRKSFGANRKHISVQFLVENVFVSFLGCIISIVLSAIALYFINKSNFIPNIQLSLYPLSILYSLIICTILGILSGVFPAIKMSRLQIAKNIKN
jgi:putative ABC transport system permease protein